ncbi:cell wall-binding protein YocH [Paraliobacillus ryukyuensis]|uniref:3D (Asp-Asp-Asp) domain-containing protein n=1 Tax=Paraliobacillus ryukyuensis TaxID=200904 RepID=A0A366EDI5_9BACI|nr:3D domain-containing protein [Paraliobacillus ryukyuensis]RBP00442.1 3D (Asp-Asp-Asp) domain-containing protein [Paraliobacillus ryukyuensis]
MIKKIVAIIAGILIACIATTQASAKEYQVEKGDSLWEIARENEINVDDLKKSNSLTEDIIFPGQSLQIDKEIVYTVKAGDTLSEIAHDYQVRLDDLIGWNELTSDLILVDQELVIKQGNSVSEETEKKSVNVTKTTDQAKTEETSHQTKETATSTSSNEQETLTMTATAYTADCSGCSGITATGINLNNDRNKKVIAVDPDVIPLGTRVYVEGYGEAVAGDTGGAINGNKIDLHVPTKKEAYEWGVRTVNVTILSE